MDKTRFLGATVLEYFGLSPKNISIEDAANQLVQELTENPLAYDVKSPVFSTQVSLFSSNAALAALRIMHGGEPENDHDQKGVFKKKIKDARENYLKQAGNKNKGKAVTDFDEKVNTLLAQKLNENTRSLYFEKEKELKQSFQNGFYTRDRCNQEMVYFLKEINPHKGFSLECEAVLTSFIDDIKNQKNNSLEKEVMAALTLIEDEKGNVTDGLFYLFNGEIKGECKKKMEFFDRVLTKILDNKKFAPPEAENKVQYRRNFIAKSREKLASWLPEPEKTEFLDFEKEKRDEFILGKSSYESYRNSVCEWLANRPLESELKKALHAESNGKVCELLSDVLKESDFYNNRLHQVYRSPYFIKSHFSPSVHADLNYNKLMGAAFSYVDSKPNVLQSNEEKYQNFMTSAKERLLEALPRNIREAHEQHMNIIGELLQKNYIDKNGYEDSRSAYLLVLAATSNDEKNPGSGAASNYSKKSGSNSSNLREIVSNALPGSIVLEGNEKDILKALILCWGESLTYRDVDEKFNNFGKAKSNYLKSEKLDYASDPDMLFRADSEFSIEARAQLVDKLSPQLREAYRAREKLLSEHLGKSHITHETYWRGMVLFLREHRPS